MLLKMKSYVLFVLSLMLSFIFQQALALARHSQELRLSFKAKLALLFAPLALIPSIASAAIPEGVTTAISSAATDVATVGAAVILVVIGIKVWKWLKGAF